MPRALVVAALLVTCGVSLVQAQRRAGRQDTDGGRRGRAAASVGVPNGTIVTRDLAYVHSGDPQHVLDLYVPRPGRTVPALIVVVHGGGWRAETRNNAHLAWGIPILLRAGFAVASVDHRPTSRALFPAQIHDVKAAVRWLRANASTFGYSTDRVGAWGTSSGGHLVALLGTSADVPEMDGALGVNAQSARVHAVVDWFGPTDFLQMDAHRLPDGGITHNRPNSPESQLVGGPIQSMQTAVRAANPITYVTADDPPFLILHGDRDRLVPHHQSEILHNALRAAAVPSQLQIISGAGHGDGGFRSDNVGRRMVQFFERHLRAAP